MSEIFNLYCDESCHLPNDGQTMMTLGVVWCPLDKTREIATRIREIKVKHGLAADFEIKWTKVSPAKKEFYLDVVDYFFDDDDLHFRGLVADKSQLDHEKFGQDHDDWYYKMMFLLLQTVLVPNSKFRIYLDKKDTRSAEKVAKLHDVLCHNAYDFQRTMIERVQVVESHAIEQLQIADLMLGALGYVNRHLAGNAGKETLIARIRERSGYSLERNTLLRETKFNLFRWQGRSTGVANV
jgi:hypothetical protein